MTEPIIEASHDLTFLCHQYVYPELASQMEKGKLHVWNNKWSEIFDFSKRKDGQLNYKVVPDINLEYVPSMKMMQGMLQQLSKIVGKDLDSLKDVPQEAFQHVDLDVTVYQPLIPFTLGKCERKFKHIYLLLIFEEDTQTQAEIIRRI